MDRKQGRKLLLIAFLLGALVFTASARTVIDVDKSSGGDLDNFDLEVDGEGVSIERTGIDRAELDLDEGEYDITISKLNYRTLERTIYVDEDEDSTYVFTITREDDGYYTIDAVDEFGNDLDGLNITVQGDDTDIFKSNINRAQIRLEEGRYDIIISKEGYQTASDNVYVDEDEEESILTLNPREDVSVERIESSNAVCSGGHLQVDTVVRNRGGTDEVVSLSASGFGKILQGKSFVINSGETKTYRFIFTNIRGNDEESFRVTLENFESSESKTVNIAECQSFGGTGAVDNIDMALYSESGSGNAFVNELVRVKGFADGSSGKVTLDLSVDGEKISEVTTDEGGYFETFYRPSEAGVNNVEVSTSDVSDSAEIEIVPTADVTSIDAPDKVFESESFEICGDVESAIDAKVILLRDGEVIPEKSTIDSGRVCFEMQESRPGTRTYEIRALTYGTDGSASKEVQILESGDETTVFPASITTIETEGNLVRVQLYNTNDEPRNYSLNMEGIPEDWFNTTEKYAYLEKGERRNVYFYISPGKSGSFSPILEVETGGEIIYSDRISIDSVESENPVEVDINLWDVMRWVFFVL